MTRRNAHALTNYTGEDHLDYLDRDQTLAAEDRNWLFTGYRCEALDSPVE